MTKPTKACVDCAYFREQSVATDDKRRHLCRHPDARDFSIVVGYRPQAAAVARMAGSLCGPAGKLFEARPEPSPWPFRLLVTVFIVACAHYFTGGSIWSAISHGVASFAASVRLSL